MKAWEQFITQQEVELGVDIVRKWLKPLKVVHFDACNLYLEAKDSFQVNWFEEHIRAKVLSSLHNNNRKKIKVHIKASAAATPPLKKANKKGREPADVPSQPKFTLDFDFPDPHCTLENFVVDEGNVLADKLFHKMIYNPMELGAFNPVYIHGGPGTGKTHLLMAAGQALQAKGLRVIYVRAETFTEHVVSAIRLGEMSHFREVYRNSDLLLIDDVHIFARKNATQEELFHTFNTLHIAGKQIILSANCAPAELQNIEPRLVSRFEWGIVLPLEPLKKEGFRKILEQKCVELTFTVHPKVIDFLLDTFTSGTKALVKALHALVLRSHMKAKESDLSLENLNVIQAKQLLADLIREEELIAVTPVKIIQLVAAHFGICLDDLQGKCQVRESVKARQMAMYLCRMKLNVPFIKIGELFGKDHSTVMSSVRAIQKALDQDEIEIVSCYNILLKKLQASEKN